MKGMRLFDCFDDVFHHDSEWIGNHSYISSSAAVSNVNLVYPVQHIFQLHLDSFIEVYDHRNALNLNM